MNQHYPDTLFLNGRWLAGEQATISVFDRGFLFGDGIYEVIPFYKGLPFTLTEHLGRLQSGLDTVGIAFSVGTLENRVLEAIARAAFDDGIIYIQVTRGVAPRTHRFPAGAEPTVLLYASPFDFSGYAEKRVQVRLATDFRWQRCNIKSTSLMANVLANNDAHEAGLAEYVFERSGTITEGSHTSVFFVRDGCLYTHPNGPHILPGITRGVVISIAAEIGVEVREEGVAVADLRHVDEAFLTGTTMQLTAVRSFFVGDRELTVGMGAIGPVTRRLQHAFEERTKPR